MGRTIVALCLLLLDGRRGKAGRPLGDCPAALFLRRSGVTRSTAGKIGMVLIQSVFLDWCLF
jgi:hypothetical protein